MEKFNKSIEGIRKMLADKKDEKYAISNQDIMVLDEYIKNLYLKVLCTLVQYENNPTDMQILFLKRIVNGMGVDAPVEEYMRKALEISETDMQEFLSIMAENKVKYYFVLEGILLVSLGNPEQENYEYLSEIIELINVNKDDLEYVSLVAKSVLWQQSSFYDEAKNRINERVQSIDFTSYIKNYYAGAIVDTNEVVHYSTPDKKYSDTIEFRRQYKENKVIIENLNINVASEWKFEGCDEVILNNCNFAGGTCSLLFFSCRKVTINKCRFENFREPVLIEEENSEFSITECEFENCYTYYTRSTYDWKALGGVIFTTDSNRTAKNIITATSFKNCGGKNSVNYYSSALISNCICEVNRCKFYNCWNYNENTKIDPENWNRTLFLKGTEGVGNTVTGSALLC